MKKALSLLLVLAMVLSMVPAVFAAEASTAEGAVESIDDIVVIAGETKTYQYTVTGNYSYDLTIDQIGDATVTVAVNSNEAVTLEPEVNTEVDTDEGAWEGDIDGYVTASGTFAVTAGDVLTITVAATAETSLQTSIANEVEIPGTSENSAILVLNGVATQTVTVPANTVVYYCAYINGMLLTINDGEAELITTSNPRMPYVFTLTGGETDTEYVLSVAYPVGHVENPAELVLGDNSAAVDAGDTDGYYYTWTAPADGTLTLTMSTEAAGWMYVVNNMTTYVYGDTQWSDSDPVVNPATVEVAKGDELQIIVNTYNPEDTWNNPAGTVVVNAAFEYTPGTEDSPIFLGSMENTVTNTGTLWYQGYFSGTVMTVTGSDFTVSYNGETLTPVDGVVSVAVTSANPRMPVVFSITGEGDYQVNFAYPVGSQSNPDTLVIGDNVASIEAGSQGYYYTYTATEDGTLSITMPSDMGWSYVINNMTTYVYGDTQWSDSDPVVNPGTVEVTAGDEIQIIVNTYDPADSWNAPAGKLIITAALIPAGPVIDESLKFQTYALSFQEDISIQFVLRTTVSSAYDSVWVECVHEDPVDGTMTETLVGTAKGAAAIQYKKNMKSWSMPDMVTVTLYAEKDGVTYQGQVIETSIEILALELLAKYSVNESQVKYCPTLVDMLNYGAAVQTAYKHNAEDLANADLGDYASYATTEDPTINATNSKTEAGAVTVIRHAISMSSQVQLQTIFKGDVTAYELRYTVDGETTVIPGSEFTAFGSNYQGIVAVKAANMRKVYTIGLYDATTGEAVSAIYTSSVEGFATEQLNGTYRDVIIAMMKYGDSVASLAS